MPKKKGSKKKKAGKKSSTKVAAPAGDIKAAGPTPLEIQLRLELESLDRELVTVKREAEEASAQYKYLLTEANLTEQETKEYESFMSSKAVKERSKIEVHLWQYGLI